MGIIPFGYTMQGDQIQQVPEQAADIRLAYELATVRNMGYKAITNYLNGHGLCTKSGKLFMAETTKGILKNPALVGGWFSRVVPARVSRLCTKTSILQSIALRNGTLCSNVLKSDGKAGTEDPRI